MIRCTEGLSLELSVPRVALLCFPGRVSSANKRLEDASEGPPDWRHAQVGHWVRIGTAQTVAPGKVACVRVEGRKVVLGFTDGDDTASRSGMGDVLDRARDEETMIYAIGLESEYFNGQRRVRTRPDRGLRRVAQETGGGYFELKRTDDLGPTFSRVVQDLHSQYTLGFTPVTLDGREHRLVVRMKQRGMNARARRTYIASPERLTSPE